MTVNLNTEKKDLVELYNASSGSLPVDFEPNLSNEDLINIIKKNDKELYSGALYEAITMLDNSSDDICKALMNADSFDSGVASAIATSGKASINILKQLVKKGSKQVVQHVNLALLQIKLNKNDSLSIRKLFYKYSKKDNDFATTARYLIASHQKTPANILDELANDEYEHVTKAALNNNNYKK